MMGAIVVVALLLGCVGAGRLVLAPRNGAPRPDDGGVAGLTGLALLTALGGWLVLAGSYSAAAGWLLLALGAVALGVEMFRAGPRPAVTGQPAGSGRSGAWLLGLLALGLATARILGEFTVPVFNVNDDLPGYWHFPRLLQESGGFLEPFNVRRLITLGAAPFVQGFFWPHFRLAAAGMADAVLGQLVIWAAARAIPGALSSRPQAAWVREAFGLAGLLLSLALLRENAMPVLLPMGGALVLLLLTRRLTASDTQSAALRAGLAWGLVAAWIIGLRVSNAPFPAAVWLVGALVAVRHGNRNQAWSFGAAALATVLALLPWNLTLWHSSGTPLFPLLPGNYHLEGGLAAARDLRATLAFVGDCLWTNLYWLLLAVAGLAALRPVLRLLTLQVVAGLAALLVISALLADNGQAVDSFSIHRYSAPFCAASFLFLAGAALMTDSSVQEAAGAPRRRLQPLLLALALMVWLLFPVALRQGNDAVYWMSNLDLMRDVVTRAAGAGAQAVQAGLTVRTWPGEADYAAAQAALPDEARLVSATEKPFLFRYDRQVMHTLDIPGLVSPPPGMPSFAGPEPVAAYLRSLGYTHLAFTPSAAGTGLYSATQWLGLSETGTRSERNWARYMLQFLQNEDRLARTYEAIYRSPELVVLDLHGPLQASQQAGP